LESLDIDPARAVKLIVATHWHDDHVSGLRHIVARCVNAKFCCSSALGKQEFLGVVQAYEKQRLIAVGSGVREIYNVFEILRKRNQPAVFASPNRLVYAVAPFGSGHGQLCRVWTLSPSDKQYHKFLSELTLLMPKVKETGDRCTPQTPNHLSVATWIELGRMAILLGGDLEETGDTGTGWSVIIDSSERPEGAASVFKIPHHGSENAHNNEVWSHMLVDLPFALLTPWNRGLKLPTANDVNRIGGLTRNAYSTARLQLRGVKKRSTSVEKTLREAGITIRSAEPTTGAVRMRNRRQGSPATWQVELFKDACHLSKVFEIA
jgi:hypothetical protein